MRTQTQTDTRDADDLSLPDKWAKDDLVIHETPRPEVKLPLVA